MLSSGSVLGMFDIARRWWEVHSRMHQLGSVAWTLALHLRSTCIFFSSYPAKGSQCHLVVVHIQFAEIFSCWPMCCWLNPYLEGLKLSQWRRDTKSTKLSTCFFKHDFPRLLLLWLLPSNTSTSITPASTTGASSTALELLVLLACGVTIPWGGGTGMWRLHTYCIYIYIQYRHVDSDVTFVF